MTIAAGDISGKASSDTISIVLDFILSDEFLDFVVANYAMAVCLLACISIADGIAMTYLAGPLSLCGPGSSSMSSISSCRTRRRIAPR